MAESYPDSLYVIPGEPVPKGRPRVTRAGQVYTPPRTRQYEERIAWLTKRFAPLEGPLSLQVTFYARRTGDIDNRIKALLDGLQLGGALANDNQVVEVHARLVKETDRPRVEFRLSPFDDSS